MLHKIHLDHISVGTFGLTRVVSFACLFTFWFPCMHSCVKSCHVLFYLYLVCLSLQGSKVKFKSNWQLGSDFRNKIFIVVLSLSDSIKWSHDSLETGQKLFSYFYLINMKVGKTKITIYSLSICKVFEFATIIIWGRSLPFYSWAWGLMKIIIGHW